MIRGVIIHTYSYSIWEAEAGGLPRSLRSAWTIEQVQDQPKRHSLKKAKGGGVLWGGSKI